VDKRASESIAWRAKPGDRLRSRKIRGMPSRRQGKFHPRKRSDQPTLPKLKATAFSDDAEEAVLSAMLMEQPAVERARALLHEGMFCRAKHAKIFRAILSLSDRGDHLDPLTLSEELERAGNLESIGGKDFIAYLLDVVPTAANVEYHAKIVRSKALDRRVVEIQAEATEASRLGKPASEIAAWQIQELDRALTRHGNEPTASLVESRFHCISDTDLEQLPQIQFVLAGLIPERSLAELHGPPGSGKSFLALDFAMCIATGRLWNFRNVHRGAVVYVAAEGSAGIGQRSKAWKHVRAFSGSAGVYFVTRPVNLRDRSEIESFVRQVRAQVPEQIKLVVFDTLARCMIGGDENSSRDMGQAIDGADLVRTRLECAVLLVHHTRKDSEVERGSTALRGAVDVMLALKVEDNSGLIVSCEKMKDAPPFERIELELEPVLDSCVITPKTGRHQSGGSLPKNQRLILESLTHHFEEDGAYSGQLQAASGLEAKSFYRAIGPLVREGYVISRKEGRAKRYTIGPAALAPTGDNSQ
jgi:AAA domain/DnaB-like helicase N terminal domain